VAALICLNYSNAQIAARLSISITTVSTHVRNILTKMGLHSKVELRQLFSDLISAPGSDLPGNNLSAGALPGGSLS
jgi:hypothetical protein